MASIDKMATDGTFDNISKKEKLQISRVRAKLETNLGSIADLTRLPAALFIVDISKEHIAVAEAKRLNIPTFAIVDTNSDPNAVDYAIPANDDASTSIALITSIITKAIEEGLSERKVDKETAAAEEKEGGKTSRDEAESLAQGAKFKSSEEEGGVSVAKKTATGAKKPRTGTKK
jgi:small subunit ribosomal protein S2